jgi:hypothetical protein
MKEPQESHEGSCLCGRVRYRIEGPLGVMMNCHCTDCRKSHAAAFATYVEVPWSGFRFLKGEDHLTTYRAESGTKRSFCRTCGSIVTCWSDEDKLHLEISASTLDTPTDRRPEYHIFVRSKASWYDIKDGRPQHKTYSDRAG